MNFIILDLEWNTAFSRYHKRYINEIIEFGAVKLDQDLRERESFQILVSSQVAQALTDTVTELTHLSREELMKEGVPFAKALHLFQNFVGEDSVVMTWSETDLHVLLDNCRCFTAHETIPFLRRYLDLQVYIQQRVRSSESQQLGLCAAAELCGVQQEGMVLHRALDDSRLEAEILRRCFDPSDFAAAVRPADCPSFYDRLCFKNYFISQLDSPDIDPAQLRFRCESCGSYARRKSKWMFQNKAFHADFECRQCQKRFHGRIQFKKTYDDVVVKRAILPLRQPKAAQTTEKAERNRKAICEN